MSFWCRCVVTCIVLYHLNDAAYRLASSEWCCVSPLFHPGSTCIGLRPQSCSIDGSVLTCIVLMVTCITFYHLMLSNHHSIFPVLPYLSFHCFSMVTENIKSETEICDPSAPVVLVCEAPTASPLLSLLWAPTQTVNVNFFQSRLDYSSTLAYLTPMQ